MSQPSFFRTSALLGMLTTLGPLGLDVFIPAMALVAIAIGSDHAGMQLSISAIFFGGAFGQLIYGPLADRFGRKPVIVGALTIFIIAVNGAMLAPNLDEFIAWRFLQGLAAASGRILAGATARDLYERERLGQMISAATMVGALAAIGSPIIGGLLVAYLPWQSVFVFMTVICGLILLGFIFFFGETLPPDHHQPLQPITLARNFLELFRHGRFMSYLICIGFSLIGLSVFLASAASVLIDGFGLSTWVFGAVFATVSTGFTIGTIVGGRLVVRLGIARTLRLGVIIGLIAGLAMATTAIAEIHYVAAVMVPMVVYVFGFALVMPPAVAAALSLFPEKAGTASSVQGFTMNFIGASAAALVGAFTAGGQFALSMTVAFAGLATATIYLFFVYPHERRG